MQCPSCDTKKAMKLEIIVHRFKESGLDNIILHGVRFFRCSHCGESIYDFGNLLQLNSLITDCLLKKKELLSGKEIRFLRTYVGYSSESFAKIIGLDKTSFSRIENERAKVSNQVNMAVRFIVGGKLIDRNYDLHDLFNALENDHLLSLQNTQFKVSTKGYWQLLVG